MKNPLLKYIMKNNNKENIFHSSIFGKLQNGASFGSTSSESFNARLNIDKNRKIIKNYRDSHLASNTGNFNPRPKTYTAPNNNPSSQAPTNQPKAPPIPKRPPISR